MKKALTILVLLSLLGIVPVIGQKVIRPSKNVSVIYYKYDGDGCIIGRAEKTDVSEMSLNADSIINKGIVFSITPTIVIDNILASLQCDGDMDSDEIGFCQYSYSITSIIGITMMQGVFNEVPATINVASLEPNQYIIYFFKDKQFVSSHQFIKQ